MNEPRRSFLNITRTQIDTRKIEQHLAVIAECLQVLTEHVTGKVVGELRVQEKGTSEVFYTDERADAEDELRGTLSKLREQWAMDDNEEAEKIRDGE